MLSGVGAADGRDGRAAGNDELVCGACLIRRTRLSHDEVVKIQS